MWLVSCVHTDVDIAACQSAERGHTSAASDTGHTSHSRACIRLVAGACNAGGQPGHHSVCKGERQEVSHPWQYSANCNQNLVWQSLCDVFTSGATEVLRDFEARRSIEALRISQLFPSTPTRGSSPQVVSKQAANPLAVAAAMIGSKRGSAGSGGGGPASGGGAGATDHSADAGSPAHQPHLIALSYLLNPATVLINRVVAQQGVPYNAKVQWGAASYLRTEHTLNIASCVAELGRYGCT